jgi:hypothetical protein
LKRECHSKTSAWLKECSPKVSWSISRFSEQIYQASCKTWCRHVARFCHPSQTKRNTKSKNHLCKNNVCSQCSDMWQTDAIGLRKCDLGFPSHLLSSRQLQQ